MRRSRISFLCGLAIGFVAGTRAGRERYEQMRRLARRVVDSPAAQRAADAVQAQAASAAGAARDKITAEFSHRVPKLAGAVNHKGKPG